MTRTRLAGCIAAVLVAAGLPTAANAYCGGPMPTTIGLLNGFPNMLDCGLVGPTSYGYHGPANPDVVYRGPTVGFGGGVRADVVVTAGMGGYRHGPRHIYRRGSYAGANVTTVTEDHPFRTAPQQYRCFADGRPSGGPGTGTGWCNRN